MTETTTTATTAAATTDTATTAAATTATPAASLIDAGTTTAAPTGTDWIPEKYRVTGADGAVDVEASARKVTEAHAALEGRMRTTGLPPATPDAYVPEGLPDGFNFDEVKADPMYQDFAAKAHAAGLTNAQLGLVLGEWNARAGAVAGEAAGITLEAAKAELVQAWGGDEAFGTKIKAASEATAAIAAKAGMTVEQINDAGLGRNPTFLRLMESLSAEFKPDGSTPAGLAMTAGDFDSQLAELRAHEGYANANHPEHAALMAKKAALYERRYPKKTS